MLDEFKSLIISFDIQLFYYINNLPHNGLTRLFFLSFRYVGFLTAIFSMAWLYVKDVKKRKILLMGFFAVISTWIIAHGVVKNIVMRPRPAETLEGIIVDGFHFMSSFPSGETAVAFSFATVLYLLYPKRSFTYLGFFIACIIAVSRVYLGAHYPSDVVGGAIIGIVIPYIVINKFKIFKIYG